MLDSSSDDSEPAVSIPATGPASSEWKINKSFAFSTYSLAQTMKL
jgi:hypothetical protein